MKLMLRFDLLLNGIFILSNLSKQKIVFILRKCFCNFSAHFSLNDIIIFTRDSGGIVAHCKPLTKG